MKKKSQTDSTVVSALKPPGLVVLSLIFLLLGACGKKGPLYLPEEQSQPQTSSENPQPIEKTHYMEHA